MDHTSKFALDSCMVANNMAHKIEGELPKMGGTKQWQQWIMLPSLPLIGVGRPRL